MQNQRDQRDLGQGAVPKTFGPRLLAFAVFVTTVSVGLFGPVPTRQFFLEGTPAADAYVELQTATVTIIAIVLTINQLVLSPELGAVSNQRQRLDDTISTVSTSRT